MKGVTGLLVAALMAASLPGVASAGFEEGVAAYERNDFEAAMREFLPLARAGNAWAQYNVGVLHHHGLGVEADLDEAVKWYGLAAGNGHAWAQRTLGDLSAGGAWGKPDFADAAQWYRLAAEQNDAEAQRKLGALYLKGRGVPRDRDAAVEWLRRALAQGDAEARRLLAEAREATPPASTPRGTAQGPTHVANCQGGFPNATYDIDVRIEFPQPRINHGRSIAELGQLSGLGHAGLVLGLMKPDFRIETRPDAHGAAVGNKYCFWINGFQVTLRYRRVDVFIAREYVKGSCEYNAILEHEQDHVRVSRENLQRFTPRIRSALTSALIPTGREPVLVASPEEAVEQIKAISNELLSPVYQQMLESLIAAQMQLDTPQEYARVRAQCRNW